MSCPCGSAWFTLDGADGTPPHGALAIDFSGNVIAYTGRLRCIECYRQWTPAVRSLRAL